MDPLRIAVRAVFGFTFALVMVRLSGARTVKQGDPSSFVVALIIGDMFDDLFWGDVPAAQFVVGVGALVVVHLLNRLGTAKSGRRLWQSER